MLLRTRCVLSTLSSTQCARFIFNPENKRLYTGSSEGDIAKLQKLADELRSQIAKLEQEKEATILFNKSNTARIRMRKQKRLFWQIAVVAFVLVNLGLYPKLKEFFESPNGSLLPSPLRGDWVAPTKEGVRLLQLKEDRVIVSDHSDASGSARPESVRRYSLKDLAKMEGELRLQLEEESELVVVAGRDNDAIKVNGVEFTRVK